MRSYCVYAPWVFVERNEGGVSAPAGPSAFFVIRAGLASRSGAAQSHTKLLRTNALK